MGPIISLSFLSLDGLKKCEIEMKPNQAYETVTRAQPAAKIHTEPCSAYGVAAHANTSSH